MAAICHRIVGNSLFVGRPDGGEERIEFAWPIAHVLECDDVLVLRIDPALGSGDNENIFGVGRNAVVLWQVPSREYIYHDSAYTGMQKAGKHVWLFNWDGTELLVNPSTGDVVEEGYGR